MTKHALPLVYWTVHPADASADAWPYFTYLVALLLPLTSFVYLTSWTMVEASATQATIVSRSSFAAPHSLGKVRTHTQTNIYVCKF
jgi:hypothetical protein